MTPLEQKILESLKELDAAVTALPANGGSRLGALFARIDELTRQLPAGTAPDLLHYLHRKSYEKARLWLEGYDAENERGDCRHV